MFIKKQQFTEVSCTYRYLFRRDGNSTERIVLCGKSHGTLALFVLHYPQNTCVKQKLNIKNALVNTKYDGVNIR